MERGPEEIAKESLHGIVREDENQDIAGTRRYFLGDNFFIYKGKYYSCIRLTTYKVHPGELPSSPLSLPERVTYIGAKNDDAAEIALLKSPFVLRNVLDYSTTNAPKHFYLQLPKEQTGLE